MKNLFLNIKKYPKLYLVTLVIAIVIGFGILSIFYFWFGHQKIIGALNGTGIAGAVLVAFFGFGWLARNGAFDTISYGFTQMFSSMFGRKANKYNDMVDYKEQKSTKREAGPTAYFSFLVVGLLYFIAFAVLEIVYHVLY